MALDDPITTTDVEEETRTIFVSGKRFGISFEPIVWRTIEDIAEIERLTIGEFFTRIHEQVRNKKTVHISHAVIIYMLRYLREKADYPEFTVPAPDPHFTGMHETPDKEGSGTDEEQVEHGEVEGDPDHYP